MDLYHITRKEYVDSILKDGLVPNHSNIGFVKHYKEIVSGVIWLTDDVEYIKSTQLTKEWIENSVVLGVNIFGYIVGARVVYPTGYMKICPHEYFVTKFIPPEQISVCKNTLHKH